MNFYYNRVGDKGPLGGIFSVTVELFKRVNGFSNLYWGWGPEDMDLRMRYGLGYCNLGKFINTQFRQVCKKHKIHASTDSAKSTSMCTLWRAQRAVTKVWN